MADEINQAESNPEISAYLENEVFVPALQAAVARSRETGASAADLLNGVSNAYATMLSTLLGSRKAAADLMQAHADHMRRQDVN